MTEEADDVNAVTPEEESAIKSLKRLARKWPKTLRLVSMGGQLHVVHTNDERMQSEDSIERGEAVIEDIHGIPNDGGDW